MIEAPYEIHFGDPVHHGGPSKAVLRLLRSITTVDSRGRVYYRTVRCPTWVKLRAPYGYYAINRELAGARKALDEMAMMEEEFS